MFATHLSLAHLTLEPFAVAMFNNFSPCHPLHKLLKEHLRYIIAINTLGRVQMLKIGKYWYWYWYWYWYVAILKEHKMAFRAKKTKKA
jgi:hypothetical protein